MGLENSYIEEWSVCLSVWTAAISVPDDLGVVGIPVAILQSPRQRTQCVCIWNWLFTCGVK